MNDIAWAPRYLGRYLHDALEIGLIEAVPTQPARDHRGVTVHGNADSPRGLLDLAEAHRIDLVSDARTIAHTRHTPVTGREPVGIRLICRTTRTLDLHYAVATTLLDWDTTLRAGHDDAHAHRDLAQAATDAGLRLDRLDPADGLAGLVAETTLAAPYGSALAVALDPLETLALGIRAQAVRLYQDGAFGERYTATTEAELYGRLLADRSADPLMYVSVNAGGLTALSLAALADLQLLDVARAETRLAARTVTRRRSPAGRAR